MTIQIPPQLKDWRFILLKPGSKEAFEKNWQETANYAYDDPRVLAHLAKDGNYGVLPGPRQLLVDIDKSGIDAGLDSLLKTQLGPTFTVRTPHGGIHLYYTMDKEQEPLNLPLRDPKTRKNLGHVRANRGGYVVGPGCSLEE